MHAVLWNHQYLILMILHISFHICNRIYLMYAELTTRNLPVLHMYPFRDEVFKVSCSTSHLVFIIKKVVRRSIPSKVTVFDQNK